jgi:hypothetical protein
LAENPSSGAFGLFQFNPSSGTLQEYLPDRNPDAFIQGQAGGRYIGDRYGTPVDARLFWGANGWFADRGPVIGPGGLRDDAIPAFLSNGEYVVNAADTARNLPILDAINSGRQLTTSGVDRSVHFHGGIQALDAHAAMREADRRMSLATIGAMGALPG